MGARQKNKHSFLLAKNYLSSLLLLGFPCLDISASEQFNQYVSSEYQIAFSYPANWIEKPPRGNDQVIVKVSSNRADKATCYVEIKPSESMHSLEDLTSTQFNEIRKRYPDTILLQQTLVESPLSGSLLHVRIQFENFDQIESIENIRLYLLHKEQQIGLICGAMTWAMEANDGRLRKQLFEVVESLELLDKETDCD